MSRIMNLIKTPYKEINKLKIKTIVFNGTYAKECITEINTGTTKSLIHITEI